MIELFNQIRFLLFFPFLVIAGIAAVIFFYKLHKKNPIRKLWTAGLYTAIVLLAALLTSFVLIEWHVFTHTSSPDELHSKSDLDAIIILGSGVDNGKPGPLMKTRLQASLPIVQRFDRIPIIVTGGISKDEPLPEAQVMKNYLVEQGIAEQRIVLEDQALDTKDNMIFSEQKVFTIKNPEPDVLVITNNFHIARSEYLLGAHTNLDARFFGTPAPKEYFYNYMVREYFAFIQDFVFER